MLSTLALMMPTPFSCRYGSSLQLGMDGPAAHGQRKLLPEPRFIFRVCGWQQCSGKGGLNLPASAQAMSAASCPVRG